MRRVNGKNGLSNRLEKHFTIGNHTTGRIGKEVEGIFSIAKFACFLNFIIIVVIVGLATWGIIHVAGEIENHGIKGIVHDLWHGSTNVVEVVE